MFISIFLIAIFISNFFIVWETVSWSAESTIWWPRKSLPTRRRLAFILCGGLLIIISVIWQFFYAKYNVHYWTWYTLDIFPLEPKIVWLTYIRLSRFLKSITARLNRIICRLLTAYSEVKHGGLSEPGVYIWFVVELSYNRIFLRTLRKWGFIFIYIG